MNNGNERIVFCQMRSSVLAHKGIGMVCVQVKSISQQTSSYINDDNNEGIKVIYKVMVCSKV